MPAAVVRLLPPALVAVACLAHPAAAGELGRVFRGLAAPLKAVHRQPPPPGGDPCVEDLAARIAWLEAHIDAYGSIVAKQPDVWGQSRLTRHRVEYEEQMRRQLGLFTERTSAAIRRSDQAFLGMALAVQSAAGRRRSAAEVPVPEVATGNSVITSIQGLLPTTNEAAGRADPVVIARTAPFAAVPDPAALPFDAEPLGLEPTVHLDQMSRYLNHLAQLRRINEGDDSADSPGYALNLIRIPVSILTGKHTRKGHGAEITVTAEPLLGVDLLPVTFRSLVINDLVDIIAPALTWCVNDPECVAWAATITAAEPAPPAARQGVIAALEGLRAKLPAIAPTAPTGVKTRRSRLPLPFTQLADVAGTEQIAILIRDTRAALAGHPANDPCIGYMDVRGHLAEELEAAWDFLALDARRHVWDELPAWNLAGLVRGRQVRDVAAIRCRFFASVGACGEPGPELIPALPGGAAGDAGVCCGAEPAVPPLCRTTTAVLAWGILVESALLDERLAADLREAATARGHAAPAMSRPAPFYGPDPAAEARAAFADYVRCRWPIRVFALDPVSEEQNVDDAHARRRELQIALATAAATGRLSAQAMTRFTRRLEQDIAVIALNRTAVGFSHGADTFGWRFYPRVQTPPTRGGLAALGETVCGPTSDGDLAQRQLEPGLRECTAIVVMPAFVPWVTLDVRTNWFALAHPKATDPGIQQTLVLSRAVKAMQSSAVACGRCAHHYRDGEIPRLLRRVDQLERELPLQTLQAQIPQENTCGGFELFNAGVTDLAPELLGWYGAPGIDPAATTTLFLVGRGFSVHDTAVIAGGRPARFTLLSREVLRVEVPAGAAAIVPAACPLDTARAARRTGLVLASAAEPLPAPGAAGCVGCGPVADACRPDCNRRPVVDIHLATPYGVSSHLLVPVAGDAGTMARGLAFDPPCSLGLTFAATKTTAAPAAKVDEFFTASCDALAIATPETFIPPGKAALRLVLRDDAGGATAATFSFPEPFFDARHGRYLIAGGDLRNFVGDTSRPATDKTLRGAVKPFLDSLLQQGRLGDDGDTVALTLTAELVAGEHAVPIDGAVAVTVTRRGRAVVEPDATP